MTQKATNRHTTVFGILISLFVALLFIADAAVFFAYISYVMALMFALFCLLPFTFSGSWKVKLAGLICLSIWILFLLPRMRTSELKAFYVDAWSIRPGMAIDEVDAIMASYVKNPNMPFAGAIMLGVKESTDDHNSRVLYIHKDYVADWCVVYPEHGLVTRVEIHPD